MKASNLRIPADTSAPPTNGARINGAVVFGSTLDVAGAATFAHATFTIAGAQALTVAAIGVTVQAYSANLASFATVAPAANTLTFLAAADYAAMVSQLGLVIGTNVQAHRDELALTHLHGADVASAGTINLTAATGDTVDVTGTTTITAITLAEGARRVVRFTGALTLTHGASLVLPTGANITTAAGDFAIFAGYAAGVVRCVGYFRASGEALVGGSAASISDPNVAHLRSDGDDGTGDGSPGAPLATLQAAIDAGFTKFRGGVGSFGNGDFSSLSANQTIVLDGIIGATTFGDITNNGFNLVVEGNGVTAGNLVVSGTSDGQNAGSITATNLQFANAYANGQAGVSTGLNGGDAGSVSLTKCSCSNVEATGGEGGGGDGLAAGGNGGAGGAISIIGTAVSNGFNYSGGAGGADNGAGAGSAGANGSLTVTDYSNVPTATATVTNSIMNGVFRGGTICQVAYAASSTQTSTGTTMPVGGVPTTSHGAQIHSLSFTPKRSDSILLFWFAGMFAHSAAGGKISLALFDTTASANAIHSTALTSDGSTSNQAAAFSHYVSSGSTTARTYTTRFGPTVSGTAYVNGNGSGNAFGGTESCELFIIEVIP